MFVRTYAGAIVGIDAVAVTVEVNIAGGGLGMYLVGLPDNAVKESEQRIRAAFENSGERMSGKKVVVSLAPADLRKEGAGFDLPIAVGILAAMGRIDAGAVAGTMFVGELSLDGSLKPVRGVLPVAVRARSEGLRRVVLPAENAAEAAVVDGIEVIGATTLRQVVGYLNGEAEIAPAVPADDEPFAAAATHYAEDFADVRGQTHVKRALEIAAAGGHNVIMVGAPGSGKTMLARRLPTILPPLSREEALETTKIHSVAGKAGETGGLMTRRPFRAPHHTATQVAVLGGGQSLLQPPDEGVHLFSGVGAPLYGAHFRSADGPHRPACGGDARDSAGVVGGCAGRGERCGSRTGRPGAGGAGGALRRCRGGSYQLDDEQRDAARILPSRCGFGRAAGAGHGAAVALGAGLRPYPEGGAHDRRPGGTRRHRSGGHRRGDQLPVAGPGELGTMILPLRRQNQLKIKN